MLLVWNASTRSETVPAKHKIVAINRRTLYDVPHKLECMAASIRNGEKGVVSDCVVILRRLEDELVFVDTFGYGTGSRDTYTFMVTRSMMYLAG